MASVCRSQVFKLGLKTRGFMSHFGYVDFLEKVCQGSAAPSHVTMCNSAYLQGLAGTYLAWLHLSIHPAPHSGLWHCCSMGLVSWLCSCCCSRHSACAQCMPITWPGVSHVHEPCSSQHNKKEVAWKAKEGVISGIIYHRPGH